MTKTILTCSALLLAACAATAVAGGYQDEALSAKEEARFERELAGRVPGEPVSCVRSRDLGSSRTYGQAVVFNGPGSTVYVNRLGQGCQGLKFGRSIKTRTYVTNICRGDIAVAFEPVSGAEYGSCPLGEFVPYRRGG